MLQLLQNAVYGDFLFLFSSFQQLNVRYKILPMTGLELWTSVIKSNDSANWAASTRMNASILAESKFTLIFLPRSRYREQILAKYNNRKLNLNNLIG